uniref:Uncharacterized protein n=1 Tax=Candidatus Methanophaga sp. ANME-1 ERB7 TaxID=2759913 RepID=A0A7G9ZAN7_9EURY|nr:hypothetical protein GHLBPCAD_00010 [Methanosarcinales archaeon ANME-1 ERB7]
MILIDEPLMFAFVAFWIIWIALFKTPPGQWLIRLCEGPLMTFARYIDFHVMKLAAFFVWVSTNPVAALRIKSKEMKLKVEQPSITPEKAAEYERDLEELHKMQPQREPMVRLNIGTALLLILVFIALYLLSMFIGRWLAP